ncbi:exonuclease domain-containing protein [Asticcacaulis sp. AC402]|uniref:exonuclease domain-containing protein n=1 Tax=Asticcacaulis sp. AC402 TaxID=1282361 RepID=UPI0003C3EE81|nr:exonuclease domain-containing protein [Asticcacaulis sp. AC402]ESQ77417.1 DNA polymerase III subunit epsilon [Asticcacaulis sp. AC402]
MSRTLVLPPTYYRDHFVEMTGFVARLYGDVLGEAERAFLKQFAALDDDAQCLFVRMCNRKKQAFTAADLSYTEIGGVEGGLERLKAAGFIRPAQAEDFRHCLNELSKTDLVAQARQGGVEGFKASWAKPELVEWLVQALEPDELDTVFGLSQLVVPCHKETLGFLLYLYFGRLNDNLLSFTLRDLGVVSVKAREAYTARFDSIDEARAGFVYSHTLRRLRHGEHPERIDLDALPPAPTEFSQGLRNDLLFQLGQHHEKRGDGEQALALYGLSSAFDSQERSVRLLYARGDHEDVRARLEAMLEAPDHDEACLFAQDFLARKFGKRRTSVFTDMLRATTQITVDELYRGFPEAAAMHHFEAEGWSGHHSENGLWPALFGLVFWDELFEGPGALSCGFDAVPQTLKDRTFHVKFADAIAHKLVGIADGWVEDLILRTFRRHEGAGNGLFYWDAGLRARMQSFVRAAPPQALHRILSEMTKDFYALRDGFPDLMLTRADEVRFVEIKAEGDQIRRHQLARLRLLQEAGFDASILKVAYRTDPDTTYVVVDVETTGGRAVNDRVTEIAAVKVRGGKIIAEWSSLINPERRIPGYITQLTGITNEMVAGAPKFVEIADDLAAFLSGAVFVAHNVNFDHSFIASEYRRLERRFHAPKLCTCAGMRKYYPGHGSYGLGPLSKEYGIRLENHHRALDDARAAAELLNLVNEKRLAA